MRRLLCKLAVTTSLSVLLLPTAIGGLIDEHSWIAEPDDGHYLLVMLQLEPKRFDTDDLEGIELKRTYSQSGIYFRDKSPESCLWPIPYHPPVYSVFFAPDGEHVLLALTDTDHTISNVPPGGALYFYHKNGEPNYWPDHEITWGYLLKRLTNRLLGRSPWNEWKEAIYDPNTQTFTIKTNQAEEFVFDIRTGKKVRTKSDWNLGIAIFLTVLPLLIYGSRHLGILNSRTDWRPRFGQVSLAEILLLATVASVLLALSTYSIALSVGVAVIGLIGGAIPQFFSRGRSSWWIGSILAVYGTFAGLLLFSTLGEKLIWRIPWLHSSFAAIAMLVGCVSVGAIIGAITGGWISRKPESVK